MASGWQETARNFVQNHDTHGKLAQLLGWINQKLAMVGYRAMFAFLSHPTLLDIERQIFRFWRRFFPIRKIGKMVFLTRHEDVRRVLMEMGTYSSADAMNAKMPAGPFVLSIDWTVQHGNELKILQDAVIPYINEDAEIIRAMVSQRAGANIRNALGSQHRTDFNIAAGYTEDIALHVVTNYIGVLILDSDQPENEQQDRSNLRDWLRLLAGQIFNPPPVGSKLQAQTAGASTGLINYLHRCIIEIRMKEKLKADISSEDSLMLRFLKLVDKNAIERKRKDKTDFKGRYLEWLDDDWVCRLIAGMIVAGNATVARAETQSIYRLMTLRGAKSLIDNAASEYFLKPDKDKRTAVLQLVYEGLRFNPMLPLMSPRYCVRNSIFSPNTGRATLIKAGEEVLPLVFAAMFDKHYFPNPNEFRADRDLGNYLHFGFGPHACFGKYIADIQFVETAAQLFGNPDFSVNVIGNTKISYQGPAVVDYPLRLVANQ